MRELLVIFTKRVLLLFNPKNIFANIAACYMKRYENVDLKSKREKNNFTIEKIFYNAAYLTSRIDVNPSSRYAYLRS